MNIQDRYVQVNIGRGDLTNSEWGSFVGVTTSSIVGATRNQDIRNIELHRGTGYWNDATTGELISEDSAHLSTFADVDLHALRVRLREIKREFRQDAIALIAGSDLL